MSIELIVASVAITCALVLYTFGVFGERRSGTLSLRHVLLFWGGLVCDTTGTMIMSNIAQQSSAGGFGIHAVTGLLAIVLMLVHAVWATVTCVITSGGCIDSTRSARSCGLRGSSRTSSACWWVSR